MKLFLVRGRLLTMILLLLFIVVSFFSGLFVGRRTQDYIPVSGQRLVPIYSVERPDQKIALTLDGTWGADYTDELLAIFSEYDISVSFFFAGYWLEEYPEMVKKITRAGHEVENHTYTHPHCTKISRQQLIEELEDTSQLIEKLTGRRPRFFRPPFGEYDNKVITTSRALDYQVVQWSLDTLDWKEPGTDFIVNRILENTGPGEIVLMHNNAPQTPEALRRVIPKLLDRGFEIVPLSELIYEQNYDIYSHNGLQVREAAGNNE